MVVHVIGSGGLPVGVGHLRVLDAENVVATPLIDAAGRAQSRQRHVPPHPLGQSTVALLWLPNSLGGTTGKWGHRRQNTKTLEAAK